MGTSEDAPSLGGVYKLVEDTAGPKIKLSTGKATLPGRKQVWRMQTDSGALTDTIALRNEPQPNGMTPLLVQVMARGQTLQQDSLDAIRQRCRGRLQALPPAWRTLHAPAVPSPVGLSPGLQELRDQMHHIPRSSK
jgi:nicotinate phosphoribosyltransferase